MFLSIIDKIWWGHKLEVKLDGSSISASDIHPTIDGDALDIDFLTNSLTYIDAAGVINKEKEMYISLLNRSHDKELDFEILAPEGYQFDSMWGVSHKDINAENSANNRFNIVPFQKTLKKGKAFKDSLLPTALSIVKLIPKK